MTHFDAPPARILIVDDHPIVRLGIRQVIAADPGLIVCGEAESADAACVLIQSAHPDLALVDLTLESGNGLELVRTIHTMAPNVRVLVLSMHDEGLFAERALRAGARGYIMKQEAIDGLVHAIREVLNGRRFVSRRLAQQLLERIGPDTPVNDQGLGHLTDRELEVFELIGRGLSTSVIAARLNVSIKTVETYRSNIRSKLNLESAADLIRFAAAWSVTN